MRERPNTLYLNFHYNRKKQEISIYGFYFIFRVRFGISIHDIGVNNESHTYRFRLL